jgi:aromatic ring-cleaving dioxygenase
MSEGDPRDPADITDYHAHVYFDTPASRAQAALLRDRVAAAFPDARLGGWHDHPVGPHTQGMYQIAFQPDRLAAILPWLMLNRLGLSVLVHPESGDDYTDHARHAAWLGTPIPLRLEIFDGAG